MVQPYGSTDTESLEEYPWCSLSMLLNFLESKAFAGEALVLGEISFLSISISYWGTPSGVMAIVLDYGLEASEFKL